MHKPPTRPSSRKLKLHRNVLTLCPPNVHKPLFAPNEELRPQSAPINYRIADLNNSFITTKSFVAPTHSSFHLPVSEVVVQYGDCQIWEEKKVNPLVNTKAPLLATGKKISSCGLASSSGDQEVSTKREEKNWDNNYHAVEPMEHKCEEPLQVTSAQLLKPPIPGTRPNSAIRNVYSSEPFLSTKASTAKVVPFEKTLQGKGIILDSENEFFRNQEERMLNPDRINLNRKNLYSIPSLCGEDSLRLLNLQNNFIRKMSSLEFLPNLVFLDLYNNHIEAISGLEGLHFLRVLMLGRNRIKRIENLDKIEKLDILDLHSNLITTIENLSHLTELRVLNLEDNQIVEVDNLQRLISLSELNVKKNRIERVYGIGPLKNLRRILIANNMIQSASDLVNFFNSTSILELSLETNPWSNDISYRYYCINHLKGLRFLDGKRVTEQERRSALKMARREAEKVKECERVAQKQEQKKKTVELIQQKWVSEASESDTDVIPSESALQKMMLESMTPAFPLTRLKSAGKSICFSRPSTGGKLKKTESVCSFEKEKVNPSVQDSYSEVFMGHLHIYGDALAIIEKVDATVISVISFTYITISKVVPYFIRMNRFSSLTSIIFEDNHITKLKQINYLSLIQRLEILTISARNKVVKVPFFTDYALFRLGNLGLKMLNGSDINFEEIKSAENRFAYLKSMILQVPHSMLFQTPDYLLPVDLRDCRKIIQGRNDLHERGRGIDGSLNKLPFKGGRFKSFAKSYTSGIFQHCQEVSRQLDTFDCLWTQVVEEACDGVMSGLLKDNELLARDMNLELSQEKSQ